MEVISKDKKSGKSKKFKFEGDLESLKTAIKKFDLNEYLKD